MKKVVLKIFVCLLIVPIGNGCDLLETKDQYPGIAIYKTRGDYFDLVTIGMKGNKIYSIPHYWNKRNNSISGKMEIINNDTIYTRRYMLPNGYILGTEAGVSDVYLELTFHEYLKREVINAQKNLGVIIPEDTLRKYILDKDPYLEFYRNNTDVKRLRLSDSLEIREIILNGEIHKYFNKLK